MANAYNTTPVSIVSANSDITIFTATASTSLLRSIRVVCTGAAPTVILKVLKTGQSSRLQLTKEAITQDVTKELLSDILPLEAGDVVTITSTAQPVTVFVSYVTNTASVAGQAVSVLTDVDTTTAAPTTGQVLTWDASNCVPATVGGTVADLNDITNVLSASPTGGDVLQYNSGVS